MGAAGIALVLTCWVTAFTCSAFTASGTAGTKNTADPTATAIIFFSIWIKTSFGLEEVSSLTESFPYVNYHFYPI
jgi:hypothetical protein